MFERMLLSFNVLNSIKTMVWTSQFSLYPCSCLVTGWCLLIFACYCIFFISTTLSALTEQYPNSNKVFSQFLCYYGFVFEQTLTFMMMMMNYFQAFASFDSWIYMNRTFLGD